MAIACKPPRLLTKVTVAASSMAMQSHKTFPLGVQTTSARWPMANDGCDPMPMSPGSYCRYELKCVAASTDSVVHFCPPAGTYWRSSSQIAQLCGGALLGAYCVPQAVQTKASIVFPIVVIVRERENRSRSGGGFQRARARHARAHGEPPNTNSRLRSLFSIAKR